MSIPFAKLHGIGNDFVFIDMVGDTPNLGRPDELAKAVCDRHKGVGADGLILVEKGVIGDFRMTMLNPDGSDGGMCGNGVRCTGKLLLDRGYQKEAPFKLEVGDRLLDVFPLGDARFRVQMGKPVLTRGGIGMLGSPEENFIDQPIRPTEPAATGPMAGKGPAPTRASWIREGVRLDSGTSYVELHGTAVSMGNPHLVLFVSDVDEVELTEIGPMLEHHPLFPNRTNVHFAQAVDRARIRQRTWERGAGVTLACGSGACAVGVAGFLTGRADRTVAIQLPGGELEIEYSEDGTVFMTGPAEHVFDGVWN